MEGNSTLTDLPGHSSHDSPSSTAIYFCSICNKPFTNGNSRDRHFRYCTRNTRNRPRSCQPCNAAKTKCSFDVPCSRCTKKGIECIYEKVVKASRQFLPSPAVIDGERVELGRNPSSLLSSGDPPANGIPSLDEGCAVTFTDNLDMSVTQFDEFLAAGGDVLDHYDFSADVSIPLQPEQHHPSVSWCAWMRGNVSLAVVTENHLPVASNPNDYFSAVTLQPGRPHAQHNADLIIQSLRSFPTMMTRRETFPWFIHPHSQIKSNSKDASLPEALSNCMSIAQMFASRTAETRLFLRQTVRAEYHRFGFEMPRMSKFELLAAMQACMIYLIMYIIDYSPEDEQNARELLLILLDLYMLFKKVGRCADLSEIFPNNSMTWEDWIFAESQRRFASLWLLVGVAVCIKNRNVCDPSQSYRTLPLPSPKSLWEAPTQSAWESEYEACHIFQTSGLTTLGDLIDAQQSASTTSNARKLDKWNAGCDNLGCLLNLIGTME